MLKLIRMMRPLRQAVLTGLHYSESLYIRNVRNIKTTGEQ
jgi:hypothetical protein